MSQSAKKRAFTSDRVAQHRHRKCNTESVTQALPEIEPQIDVVKTPTNSPVKRRTSGRGGGVLTNLRVEDLQSLNRLEAIWRKLANSKTPLVSGSDAGFIELVAAARLAVCEGKVPGALFRSLIENEDGKRSEYVEPHMEEAGRLVTAHQSRNGKHSAVAKGIAANWRQPGDGTASTEP
jgi:hypothetical protein